MIRLLADENFNGEIVRGLLRRNPHIDIVGVQDVPLVAANDPRILAWAATNDRIVLTHDRATMPNFAYARIADGLPMSGLFLLNDRFPVGEAIEQLISLDECTEQDEWKQLVVFLPL